MEHPADALGLAVEREGGAQGQQQLELPRAVLGFPQFEVELGPELEVGVEVGHAGADPDVVTGRRG